MCEDPTTDEGTADPASPLQTPRVGDIVHYWHRGSADGVYPPKCSAAIITGLSDATPTTVVALTVFAEGGGYFPHPAVVYDARPAGERDGGTWHWPEYAPVA